MVLREILSRGYVLCAIKKNAGVTYCDVRKLEVGERSF
jgi:hypothetical protein